MDNEIFLTNQEIEEVFEIIDSQPKFFPFNDYAYEYKFDGETIDVFSNISASTNTMDSN